MYFSDLLIKRINEKRSHIVVGLDPDYESLPKAVKRIQDNSLEDVARAIIKFNCELIDAIFDIVPVVKPQIAFYERYGVEGIRAFTETVNYAKKRGLIVIEDAKRNDIGSTATSYAEGHIGKVKINSEFVPVFDVDAITINAYLGTDGILPFLSAAKQYSKGLFVLVKTSNPSSTDFQDVEVAEHGVKQKLYEIIAKFVDQWGKDSIGELGYSSVGAVVGATFPNDAKILRKLMPKSYFLVPGYGAQGAKASDVVHCFNEDGYGALIAASRSIDYAYKTDPRFGDNQFGESARQATIKMNNEINEELLKLKLLRF